jgi:Arylsulfotransferase (ASST)/Secretion system C-terminal sorting domain/Bacterial Ig-like domain
MKTLFTILNISFLLFFNNTAFSQTFDYISPKNNSSLVSLNSNIILRSNENVDPASLSSNEFSVSGSISGQHQGTVKLSDDNKTVLFFPVEPFSPNENVSIVINQGIKTTDGSFLPSVRINFKTTQLSQGIYINPLSLVGNSYLVNSITLNKSPNVLYKLNAANNLPSDFPAITVDSSNNPSSGNIFLANFGLTPTDTTGNYLIILNNDGSVAKYKKLAGLSADFKVLPDGNLSYANLIQFYGTYGIVSWIVADTSLNPIDTIQCGNGYQSDMHDFLLLPNGHSLLIAYDPEPVDMSPYGGDPSATVIGAVIQELDASKNVVFQWRSWDYLPITDSYIDLTTQSVDLIHANAIETDLDGNILLSMRHLSSIIKINRQTGDIMWILGGKQNQFTFLNENESNAPNYFSFQHDVKMLPDGNLTLFDNGNQHSPNYSRAVEYKLDEQNKIVDLAWQYRHNPDIYSMAMGSVQRLSNGNILIGWGYSGFTGSAVLTEVHPDNSTALEMSLPLGQASYRVYKFPWASGLSAASVNLEVLQNNTYVFDSANDTTGVSITFNQLVSGLYANVTVNRYNYSPVNPLFQTTAPIMLSNYFNISNLGVSSFTGDVMVNINNYPAITNPEATIVYERANIDSNFVQVPTGYDSTNHVLTFTTTVFGDFAFGIPQTIDSSYAPFPFSPGNKDTVTTQSVEFKWGIRGIVSSFHLQVATDSSFNNIVVDTTGFRSTIYTDTSLSRGTFYFWRVNNTNTAGTSSWSDTANFYLSTTITGMYASNNTVVNKFKLSQNYPNPFNPSTIISYSLPDYSKVRVDIYNILGQRIETLVNSYQSKGDYSLSWNASNYASGIYFYAINATNSSGKQFYDVKKMVLLK